LVKIVIAAISAYGHLYPLMPLALACADAGHEVTVAVGPPFLGRLPLPTIAQQPPEFGLDTAFSETARRNPGLRGFDFMIGLFADVISEAVTGTLLPALEETRPDLVIYEALDAGAGIAASVLGVPSVAFAIELAHQGFAMIHPAAIRYRRDLWTTRGLQSPDHDTLLSRSLLDPTPPSLRRFSGALDVTKIPIRPIPYAESSGTVPRWLEAAQVRPRVYLTLGTVSFGAVEVLRRAISEIASLDVDLLVAVGPDGDLTALGDVADNVHLEKFVDQPRVLELVDLIVHHGGTGSVLGALSAGLPQLILPQGADQFFNAEFLSEVGAARAIRNDEYEPGAIQRTATDLLSGGMEQTAARQIQAEIAELPTPADVVRHLTARVDT
jgi:UDP-N-acetylglucosamine:LPS N-acetylglucosamine transferase